MQEKRDLFKERVPGSDIYLLIYTVIYLVTLIVLHYGPLFAQLLPSKNGYVPKQKVKSGKKVELVVVASLFFFFFFPFMTGN